MQKYNKMVKKVNNKLYEFLSFLGLEDDEINLLFNNFPGLLSRDFNSIMKCVAIVTAYGFPKTELSELIMLNPSFMLNDPEKIAKTLASIKDDIEFVLLSNPHII